jgi:hypothetical protein
MPRWLKVVIWIVVFAACAGAGAYVASRTDPFPPGVEDPGARDGGATESAAPSSQPAARWIVTLRGSSTHTFRVGGRCESSWTGRFRAVHTGPALTGSGVIRAVGQPSCDFPNAQVQSRLLELDLAGSHDVDTFTLGFSVVGREPIGSVDRGGFDELVAWLRPRIGPSGSGRETGGRGDGVGGTVVGSVSATMRCVSGCT